MHPAAAEPVVDRHDDGPATRDELAGDDVGLGHVEVTGDERAAVRPHQAADGCWSVGRSVDADGHRSVRTRRHPGRDVDVGGRVAVQRRAERLEPGHVLGRGRSAGEGREAFEQVQA